MRAPLIHMSTFYNHFTRLFHIQEKHATSYDKLCSVTIAVVKLQKKVKSKRHADKPC